MSQREDAADLASIAIAKAQLGAKLGDSNPGDFSGARILDFEKGWAIPAPPWHEKAHFFKRIKDSDDVIARCGMRWGAGFLFGQGSFKRCRRCQASVDRKP